MTSSYYRPVTVVLISLTYKGPVTDNNVFRTCWSIARTPLTENELVKHKDIQPTEPWLGNRATQLSPEVAMGMFHGNCASAREGVDRLIDVIHAVRVSHISTDQLAVPDHTLPTAVITAGRAQFILVLDQN